MVQNDNDHGRDKYKCLRIIFDKYMVSSKHLRNQIRGGALTPAKTLTYRRISLPSVIFNSSCYTILAN